MELDSRKKSRRDRMMRSKSFDTKEVRETGRKEAGESRGFPILWMGIIEDVFSAFSAREVKRAATVERERDEYASAEGQ